LDSRGAGEAPAPQAVTTRTIAVPNRSKRLIAVYTSPGRRVSQAMIPVAGRSLGRNQSEEEAE
jgi:hypothetical protein